jgi:hypothetical protein
LGLELQRFWKDLYLIWVFHVAMFRGNRGFCYGVLP